MFFVPYVIRSDSNEKEYVQILQSSLEDFEKTVYDGWQSEWTGDYLSASDIDKYTVKASDGKIVALAAYKIIHQQAYVYIVYLESAPESNPVLTSREERKFRGIGRLLFAFAVKYSIDHGCRGDVVFEAKTDELAEHYLKDFHALEIPRAGFGTPRRFMLSDSASWEIFSQYLMEEIPDGLQ